MPCGARALPRGRAPGQPTSEARPSGRPVARCPPLCGGSASVRDRDAVTVRVEALLLAGLIALQLLAAGYSLTLADGAAEAGAMALAAGRPAAPAVREALPGWARQRIEVGVEGGELTVRLRPPSPFEALARRLEISSSAWVRRPEER